MYITKIIYFDVTFFFLWGTSGSILTTGETQTLPTLEVFLSWQGFASSRTGRDTFCVYGPKASTLQKTNGHYYLGDSECISDFFAQRYNNQNKTWEK